MYPHDGMGLGHRSSDVLTQGQYGWTLKTSREVEEAKRERPHTTQHHFNEMSRKGKGIRRKAGQWPPGAGEGKWLRNVYGLPLGVMLVQHCESRALN